MFVLILSLLFNESGATGLQRAGALIKEPLNSHKQINDISRYIMPILGQVALNDPAQKKNPIWETSAHNDPSSEQLKEISQVALNDTTPRNSLSHPPIILKKKN